MTFDYFNTSHLAFGSKITKAFTQLERLLSEGEDNLQDLFAIYEFYNQYIDKNYPAPFPTRPDAPVRAKELYDLLNDGNTLKNVYMDEDGVLHVSVNLFKRISNRFTIATGSTTLKKGYAFCRDSISNKNYTREIQFVEDYESGIGNFLFEFRIDADNNINIVGDESLNYYFPSNFDHITSMRKDDGYIFQSSRLDRASDVYTAQDYEVVLLVGYMSPNDADNPKGSNISNLHYTVNGEERMKLCGRGQRAYDIAYLKPGDILRASCKYAFKVKYISGEAIPPQPEPPEPEVPTFSGEYVNKYGIHERLGSISDFLNDTGEKTVEVYSLNLTFPNIAEDPGIEITCDMWDKISSIEWEAGYLSTQDYVYHPTTDDLSITVKYKDVSQTVTYISSYTSSGTHSLSGFGSDVEHITICAHPNLGSAVAANQTYAVYKNFKYTLKED